MLYGRHVGYDQPRRRRRRRPERVDNPGFRGNPGGDGRLRITEVLGRITVNKGAIANWPAGQTASLQFTATCASGSYSATLIFSGAAASVDIADVPLGTTCSVTETLPTAPTGYSWGTATVAPSTRLRGCRTWCRW